MKTEKKLRTLEKVFRQVRKDYEKGHYDKIETHLGVEDTGTITFGNPKTGTIEEKSDGSKKITVTIDITNNSQRAIDKYYKR